MNTICISCGEPMSPASERPPSGGNPNQCVPCATGINFPSSPKGSAESPGAEPGRLTATGRDSNLPAATAPRSLPQSSRDGGPETTPAAGNPFPAGRWTDLVRGCASTEPAAEAATKPAVGPDAGSGQFIVVTVDHDVGRVAMVSSNLDVPIGLSIGDEVSVMAPPARTRTGVHYMGPAYSPQDCDQWRMGL
jgi:hypothetical protein